MERINILRIIGHVLTVVLIIVAYQVAKSYSVLLFLLLSIGIEMVLYTLRKARDNVLKAVSANINEEA